MILKVLRKKQETNNVFSLILEKPQDCKFYAGQYLDVELINDTRAFTISSSPTENFLMITPKKGVSKFKRFMEKLKTGDTVNTSHSAGTFTLDQSMPAVFIAGGIGITPFRSMIKYALDKKLSTHIVLFYSSKGDFAFKNELTLWQKKLPNLNLYYLDTSKTGRLKLKKISNSIYYLAGPPKMVDDFAKKLLDLGVDEVNIRYDRFDGY